MQLDSAIGNNMAACGKDLVFVQFLKMCQFKQYFKGVSLGLTVSHKTVQRFSR